MLKILFATDGSAPAREALDFLRALPLPEGTALRIVTVVPPPEDSFQEGWRAYELVSAGVRRWAEGLIADTAAALDRAGLELSADTRAGDSAHEIIEAARRFEADFVVVGSRGLSGLQAFMLGSVARNVAHHAGCSVLLGREPRYGLQHVVLATDGSDHAARAVELMTRLPLPHGAKVTVVSVARGMGTTPPMLPVDAIAVQEAQSEVRDALTSRCQGLAERAAHRLREAGMAADALAVSGDPSEEILRLAASREADLIVLGSKGVSLIEGLFVGSVAERLLTRAECSVFVAR